MVQDGGNPASPRAVPHALVGITPLPRVLLFGSFLGSRKVPKMGAQMDPKRDRKRTSKRILETRTRKRLPRQNGERGTNALWSFCIYAAVASTPRLHLLEL